MKISVTKFCMVEIDTDEIWGIKFRAGDICWYNIMCRYIFKKDLSWQKNVTFRSQTSKLIGIYKYLL